MTCDEKGIFSEAFRTELWEGEAPIYDNENSTYAHENSTDDSENSTDDSEICCPKCGSDDLAKSGKTQAGSQRWQCKACGKRFV